MDHINLGEIPKIDKKRTPQTPDFSSVWVFSHVYHPPPAALNGAQPGKLVVDRRHALEAVIETSNLNPLFYPPPGLFGIHGSGVG